MAKGLSEFDQFARDYEVILNGNIKFSGFPPSYFDEYKVKEVAGYLTSLGWQDKEIKFLNFGCGIGKSEKYIRQYLPHSKIYAVDVSQESIAYAKEKNKEMKDLWFSVSDGESLPFDTSFDVIFTANVFHHIPRERHLHTLRMLNQALRPNGLLFLFEHNSWNPITVRTVAACPFDEDASLLSPLYTRKILAQADFNWRKIRFKLFFPKPLAFLTPLEKYLRKIPLGAQYYFIARKRA